MGMHGFVHTALCVDVVQHANTSMHLHAWPHVCPVGPAHEVGDAGS